MLPRLVNVLLALASCLPPALAGYKSPMDIIRRHTPRSSIRSAEHQRRHVPYGDSTARGPYEYYNNKTASFWVNGSAIPDVDFDIGESYAGLLPISEDKDDEQKLWFWFFPTTGEVKDEVVIWLNGGPGCSSLEGLLQENGPFLWQYGTYKPVRNPYAWNNLTNMIWVEQPVGTGFTTGAPTATSSSEAASQFLGFFRNFIATFGLHHSKIYVTGESYAGTYIPYIVDAMHATSDKTHFDARGLMIYDPVLTDDVTAQQVPVAPFVEYWANLLALDPPTMAEVRRRAEVCGYAEYIDSNLVFPPRGPFPPPPPPPPPPQAGNGTGCDVWSYVFEAVLLKNPCFNVYHITTTCPLLYDVLGFPGSFPYLPAGTTPYFNRTDVQRAINAPRMEWEECSSDDVFVGGVDSSVPASWEVLPRVIGRNDRTVIGHGGLDYILMVNGSLLAIQNMTWGGMQGFQSAPTEPFVVPYGEQGVMGVVHTERKLTYVEINLSGHMVPQYQPGAAFRQLEYLLGRIESM